MQPNSRPVNFITIVLVSFTCVIAGGIIGATTNIVNAAVSPYYFQAILHLVSVPIWEVSVAQGIFEGLIYGIIFALIFTIILGVITKGRCSFKFALVHIAKLVGVVYICWILGGLLAMALSTVSPEWYKSAFLYVPDDKNSMLKYAWVGGSIWGEMFGGVLSIALSPILIKRSFKTQEVKQQSF